MGGVQLGLAFVFWGKTTSIVKTLVFFEMLQYRRKVIQLGSQPVGVDTFRTLCLDARFASKRDLVESFFLRCFMGKWQSGR